MTEFRQTSVGPIKPIELPPGHLKNIRLTFRFDGGKDPEECVTQAMQPLLGQARVMHYALVRRGLVWHKARWPVTAAVKKGSVKLRSPGLKRSQVEALMASCASLPEARDLEVRAQPGRA